MRVFDMFSIDGATPILFADFTFMPDAMLCLSALFCCFHYCYFCVLPAPRLLLMLPYF